MAITTTIAKGYGARLVIMAVLFTVLGAWGVYDYAVKIPRQQMLTDRLTLLEECRGALETEQVGGQQTPEVREVMVAIDAEIQRVITEGLSKPGEIMTFEEFRERLEALAESLPPEESSWVVLLGGIRFALMRDRSIPLTPEAYPEAHMAYEATTQAIKNIGSVTAPHKFDSLTQWAFISCLPFGPWFLWSFVATKRRVHRFDDDGSLTMHEGTWARDEIADIDMSRWMAKSIAWVVHRDGTRVKLDDYKYRDLHKIVGSIAHRFHPDDWDLEARPADEPGDKADSGVGVASDGEAEGEEAPHTAATPTDAG